MEGLRARVRFKGPRVLPCHICIFLNVFGTMLLSCLRRVGSLLPVFLRSSHFQAPPYSRISYQPSHPPQFFHAEFGISTCSLLLQQNIRNYSNGGKNGKAGEEDPFGSNKAREKSNVKGEGSSLNETWDFSGQGESFGGSNGGQWDDFGSGEGDNVDWNSIEPDAAPFTGSSLEEKLDGSVEGDWKESQDGVPSKEKDWADSTTDWSAESSFESSKSGDGSLEEGEGVESKEGIADEWATAEGYEPWGFEEGLVTHEGAVKDGIQGETRDLQVKSPGDSNIEAESELEKEEKQLKAVIEGPNRAFGDLIAASGITETQLESLILMKDVEGIEGLPPLRDLEDARLERMERKSTRGEYERKRQEEIAKARVRQVDEKGRAYGTGRRKCSAARVWIQPGDGKFIVNDKSFDAYFPQLEHRADLLQPFVQTKTLGLWDIVSTVKGGGVSGQVGAVRLGISRALQNWEPGLRPYLRSAGLLTRDPRMVERKKPGKAKARKSFQWVKR